MEWRNGTEKLESFFMIGELFQEGRTTKTAIAEATGFNHKTVSKYLKDNQLPKRKVNK